MLLQRILYTEMVYIYMLLGRFEGEVSHEMVSHGMCWLQSEFLYVFFFGMIQRFHLYANANGYKVLYMQSQSSIQFHAAIPFTVKHLLESIRFHQSRFISNIKWMS